MIQFLKTFAEVVVEEKPIMLNGSVQTTVYSHIDPEKYRLNAYLDMIFTEQKGYSVTQIIYFLSIDRDSLAYISRWLPSKYANTIQKYLKVNNIEVARSYMIQNINKLMVMKISTKKGSHKIETTIGSILCVLLHSILKQDGEYAFEHIFRVSSEYQEKIKHLEIDEYIQELTIHDQECIKFLTVISKEMYYTQLHQIFPTELIMEAVSLSYDEANGLYQHFKRCKQLTEQHKVMKSTVAELKKQVNLLKNATGISKHSDPKLIYVGNSAKKSDISAVLKRYTNDFTVLDGFEDKTKLVFMSENANNILVDTGYVSHASYHILMDNYKSKLTLLNRSGMSTLNAELKLLLER